AALRDPKTLPLQIKIPNAGALLVFFISNHLQKHVPCISRITPLRCVIRKLYHCKLKSPTLVRCWSFLFPTTYKNRVFDVVGNKKSPLLRVRILT
ncbi:MAG: hypothetical protein ABFR62_06535, partial [Bacteroidota bacterium]